MRYTTVFTALVTSQYVRHDKEEEYSSVALQPRHPIGHNAQVDGPKQVEEHPERSPHQPRNHKVSVPQAESRGQEQCQDNRQGGSDSVNDAYVLKVALQRERKNN